MADTPLPLGACAPRAAACVSTPSSTDSAPGAARERLRAQLAATDVTVSYWPLYGWTHVMGTREQLVAGGWVPADVRWPAKRRECVTFTLGELSATLCLASPHRARAAGRSPDDTYAVGLRRLQWSWQQQQRLQAERLARQARALLDDEPQRRLAASMRAAADGAFQAFLRQALGEAAPGRGAAARG